MQLSASALSSKKKYLILGGILILLLFIIFWLFSNFSASIKDERIFVSNIAEDQVTISWTTNSPVKKWILVTEANGLTPKILKDNKEGRIHYITVSGLKPQTEYKYKIYQNLKETASGIFSTSSEPAGARISKELSGKVLSADQKPAQGVLVYLQLVEGPAYSTLLSSVTDKEGKWEANILGAKTSDLTKDFKIATGSALLVVAQTSGQGRFKSTFPIDPKIKSVPDIILKGAQVK